MILLVAALLAASPQPDAGADWPRMGQAVLRATVPVYPGATETPIPVGESLEAHGVPMNVQSFMTDDPPAKVLAFYKAEFGKWRLPMLGNGQIEGGRFPYPSITVFDELNEVEISVIAIPSPDRHTMVLLARADMRPIREDLQRAEVGRYGGLPVYPEGRNPGAVRFTDGELSQVRVSFDTADAPEKVLGFYRQAFETAGAEKGEADPGALAFRLPDGTWRISAISDPASHQTVVSALHTEAARAAGEEAR